MQFHTHLHLCLSGEIDHVQFPTNRSPTASFECINNSTPLHLSSLAFYTLHSSPSLIQLAAMRAPRWIPLLKVLDLDEKLQNEILASLQPCQVLAAASPSLMSDAASSNIPLSISLGCGYFLNYTDHTPLFPSMQSSWGCN